ncbi:MAG: TraX family protein [Pseudolactococcus laudensis]
MMIFSLLPICLYNGKEGRKEKWLFYIFYPLHIIVLYLLSTLIFL